MECLYLDPRQLQPHSEYAKLFVPAQEDELERMRAELSNGGTMEPLLITPNEEILAGVETWRCILELGWDEVCAVVAPPLSLGEIRALMVAENIQTRELRAEHLYKSANAFFDMEPLRPQGGW